MHRDRHVSRDQLIAATKLGYKAIILTVDTPFPGNRELDLRTSLDPDTIALQGVETGGKRVLAVAATASCVDQSQIPVTMTMRADSLTDDQHN